MRFFGFAAVLGVLVSAFGACATFSDSSAPAAPLDGGDDSMASGGDGGSGDADAAADAAPGIIAIVHENAKTVSVAVDAQHIFWWSEEHSAIEKVDKDSPGTVIKVVTRMGQTVTKLAADVTGVYWLEAGPDENDGGAVDSRIMRLGPSNTKPVALRTTDSALSLLAVDATRITTTVAGGVIGISKAGVPFDHGFALSQTSLAADGTSVYYIYFGIFRLTQDGRTHNVIGLDRPRELTVDGTTIYGFMPSDGGSALFKADDSLSDQPPTAATQIAQVSGAPLFLAVDNLGLVWANASDGTIKRVSRTGGPQEEVVPGIQSPNAIAADARGVYWTTDTGDVGWARRSAQ